MNKYERWYYTLMTKARTRSLSEYSESHHIVPLSLGGVDGAENLVDLTLREHFVAHWLLTKFTFGEQKRKMQWALFMMCRPGAEKRVVSSWQYVVARTANKAALRGRKISQEQRENQSRRNLGNTFARGHRNAAGFKHTEEFKLKLSARLKGKPGIRSNKPNKKKRAPMSQETRDKISRANKGRIQTEEVRMKIKLSHKNPSLKRLEQRVKQSQRMRGNQWWRNRTWRGPSAPITTA